MWDFDDLKAAEDEANGEAPLVFSYLGGQSVVRIKAELHPEENRPEDTSLIVWPAARALARHLEKESAECMQGAVGSRPVGTGDSPESRNVLELGAGTGLVGLAALALGARSVVLTDVSTVVPFTRCNAELNDNAGHGTLDVMELDFREVAENGLPRFPTPPNQKGPLSFDIIVCSDCVLWPELFQPMLVTLDRLLHTENFALLSVVHRNAQAEVFMEQLGENFEVQDIPMPEAARQEAMEENWPSRIQMCRVRRATCSQGLLYKESRLGVDLSVSGGGKSAFKCGMHSVQMTVEQAHAMIGELTDGYSTEMFQSKLYSACEAVKGNREKEQAARHKVCLEVQGPIMTKYGFEDSMEGVIHCLSQFYFPPLALDITLQKRIDYMMLQTKPWRQKEERLMARLRIWRDDVCIYQPVVEIARTVKSLKLDLENHTDLPWSAQCLRLCIEGTPELPDYFCLDIVVPRSCSDVVDMILEARSEEVVKWLRKLMSCPDLSSQERLLEQDVPPELFGNAEFMLSACQCCNTALRYAEVGLRHSFDVVLAAVNHYGLALQWASTELQAHEHIVATAISGRTGNGRGIALQYAAPEWQGDVGMVVQAISNDAWAFQFASEEIHNNKDIAVLALQKNGMILPELPEELQNDSEVVWTAVRQNPRVLQSVKPCFQADPEIVLAAVDKCPDTLQYASPKVRADRKIVLAAVRGNGEMYRFAAPALQEDREVALAAVSSRGCMIAHIPDSLYTVELALAAVKQNPTALEFLDDDLQKEVKAAMVSKEVAKDSGLEN